MAALSTYLKIALLGTMLLAVPARADDPSAERGRYIFDAGGCLACHTDEKAGIAPLAGGPPLTTPFGTFYAPNITPDPAAGIGRWSAEQFRNAMRDGVGPQGQHYYPVFPYPTYTKMAERDLNDLWTFLKTIPSAAVPSREHDVGFPFSLRLVLLPWKWLNFSSGEWKPDPGQDLRIGRGAYLVEALTHCGECHSPRTALGAIDRSRWLAGARIGATQAAAPNLTPDASGLAEWSTSDIVFALETGSTPEGGSFDGEMREVVKNSTSRLTKEDREAIAVYLKSLTALPSAVPPRAAPSAGK